MEAGNGLKRALFDAPEGGGPIQQQKRHRYSPLPFEQEVLQCYRSELTIAKPSAEENRCARLCSRGTWTTPAVLPHCSRDAVRTASPGMVIWVPCTRSVVAAFPWYRFRYDCVYLLEMCSREMRRGVCSEASLILTKQASVPSGSTDYGSTYEESACSSGHSLPHRQLTGSARHSDPQSRCDADDPRQGLYRSGSMSREGEKQHTDDFVLTWGVRVTTV